MCLIKYITCLPHDLANNRDGVTKAKSDLIAATLLATINRKNAFERQNT